MLLFYLLAAVAPPLDALTLRAHNQKGSVDVTAQRADTFHTMAGAPPQATKWILGAPGRSCTATCKAVGRVCREDRLGEVDTTSAIHAVAREVGHQCANVSAEAMQWSYAWNPGICVGPTCCRDGSCSGACFFGSTGGRSCEAEAYSEHARLCPCLEGQLIELGASGDPVCVAGPGHTCHGDPRDLVEPFHRLAGSVASFSVAPETRFWTADATTACLRGKRVLLLGDSTMAETVHDLTLLLAGGPTQVDSQTFYRTSVTQLGVSNVTWANGRIQEEFYSQHRNMTVSVPEAGIVIRHLYNGNMPIVKHCMGLRTFFNASYKQELDVLTGMDGSSPKPDFVIVNSGLHDECSSDPSIEGYESYIQRFAAEYARPWIAAGIRVIWKGNVMSPWATLRAAQDDAAARMASSSGVTFVNQTRAVCSISDASGCCCNTDRLPASYPHYGAISKYHDPNSFTLASQLTTFALLSAMCPAA